MSDSKKYGGGRHHKDSGRDNGSHRDGGMGRDSKQSNNNNNNNNKRGGGGGGGHRRDTAPPSHHHSPEPSSDSHAHSPPESPPHSGGGGGGGGGGRRIAVNESRHTAAAAASMHSHSGAGGNGASPTTSGGGTAAPPPVVATATPPTSSPTTANPTTTSSSVSTTNRLNSSSMVNVRYYDENTAGSNGSWVMRRPAHATAAQLKNFAVVSIVIGDALSPSQEADRFRSLNHYLETQAPLLVSFVEVCEAQYQTILEQPCVRQNYAVTDWHKCYCTINAAGDRVEHGCIFLVRHQVHVDFAECQKLSDTNGNLRPFILLYSRNFSGVQTTFGVTHVDPTCTMDERVAAVTNALSRFSQVEFTALTGNLRDAVSDHKDEAWLIRECNQCGYSEVGEGLDSPLGFLVKQQARVQATNVQMVDLRFRSCAVYQFILRNGNATGAGGVAGAAATGPIAIPQPRSAKGTGPATPPTAPVKNTPPLPPDPAIVAADERATPSTSVQRGGDTLSAMFPTGPKRWRWRKDHSFHLKNPRLSPEEAAYDITSRFGSLQEALDSLNSGAFPWPAEFAVMQSTILAADTIAQCDLKTFRRYATTKPNPWTLMSTSPTTTAVTSNQTNSVVQLLHESTRRAQAATAPTPSSMEQQLGAANGQQTAAAFNAAAAAAASLRVRVWSENNCSVLYQVTPKEMKYDITTLVGVSKNNLKTAIARLNAKKTMAAKLAEKQDPLMDHPYDYALLYCPDRQGYWLIAASDVPCDVVACRLASV